jgi:malate synthase
MEDAATAEIARSQIWQWIRHRAQLQDGRTITRELVAMMLDQELERIQSQVGEDTWRKGRPEDTRRIFERVTLSEDFVPFLTVPAYELLD